MGTIINIKTEADKEVKKGAILTAKEKTAMAEFVNMISQSQTQEIYSSDTLKFVNRFARSRKNIRIFNR